MNRFIATVIQWLVVPAIIVSLFVISIIIAKNSSDQVTRNKYNRADKTKTKNSEEISVSAWSGFWAGLVIFVIYVVSQLDALQNPTLNFSVLPSFQPIPTLLGLLSGFAISFVARILISSRFSGILTLILSASSTSSLFSYFFIQSLRFVAVYISLGFALGVLLYAIMFPGTIKSMFVVSADE